MELRAIRPDEVEALAGAIFDGFEMPRDPARLARLAAVVEPDRTFAAFDGGEIVATAGAYTRELTLPGGVVPCAAVALVTTRPTHRRRGLLRALLGAVHEAAPEPVAALWPSEAAIYGRFGYGPAIPRARLTVSTERVRFRPDAPPAGDVTLHVAEEVRDRLAAVHERVRRLTPGMLDRPAAVWARRLAEPRDRSEGDGPLRAALLPGDRGYATYSVATRFTPQGPDSALHLDELVAADAPARAALWRFLCALDLVRTITWTQAPLDEPLAHLLEDARAVRLEASDAIWVAPLDPARALGARTYAGPLDVVLDVDGQALRLRDGECRPADRPPDLVLGREALGAALAGATTLAELGAAGRVVERTPGALAAASRALRGDAAPWPSESF